MRLSGWVIAVVVLAVVIGTAILNIREHRRQRALAATRSPINSTQFVALLAGVGVGESVARFVWDEVECYYFDPLTPYPEDRLIGDMHVDSDDLSDIMVKFEKQFDRQWVGRWLGPDDPTLVEFAVGLTASTTAR